MSKRSFGSLNCSNFKVPKTKKKCQDTGITADMVHELGIRLDAFLDSLEDLLGRTQLLPSEGDSDMDSPRVEESKES